MRPLISLGMSVQRAHLLRTNAAGSPPPPPPPPPPPSPPPGGPTPAPTLTGSPVLVASWDFGDSSKLTVASGKISAVSGSDGTTYTLSEATGTAQPATITAAGYGAAEFSGAQRLKAASSLGRAQTDSITVVVVGELLEPNSSGTFFSLAASSTGGQYSRHKLHVVGTNQGVSPSGLRYSQSNNVTPQSVDMGTPAPIGRHLIVGAGAQSGGSNKIYRDASSNANAASSSFTTVGSNLANVAIGADQDSDFFTGYVWRVLVYAGTLTNTNVTELATWAQAAWGINVNAASVGSAKLSWQASPDVTVDGYKIYWSQTPWGTDNSATVSGIGTTTYTITGLTSGQWFIFGRSTVGGIEGTDFPIGEKNVA